MSIRLCHRQRRRRGGDLSRREPAVHAGRQARHPGNRYAPTRRDLRWNCGWSGRPRRPARPSQAQPLAGSQPPLALQHSQGSSAGCWPAPEAPARAAPPVPWSITCCIRAVAGATVQRISARMRRVCRWTGRPVTASSTYTNVYTSSDAGRGGPAGPVPLSCRLGGGQPCARLGGQRERVVADASSAPRWETRGGWQTPRPSRSRIVSGTATLPACAWPSSGFTRGTGIDVSYGRRETVFGKHDVNWRVSAYDRPAPATRVPAATRNRPDGECVAGQRSTQLPAAAWAAHRRSRTPRHLCDRDRPQRVDGAVLQSVNGTVTAERAGWAQARVPRCRARLWKVTWSTAARRVGSRHRQPRQHRGRRWARRRAGAGARQKRRHRADCRCPQRLSRSCPACGRQSRWRRCAAPAATSFRWPRIAQATCSSISRAGMRRRQRCSPRSSAITSTRAA